VPSPGVGNHPRGFVLDQLHVADESAARVATLDQVVAQDEIVREAPARRRMEGVDVVNALAYELAPAEEIGIDAGDFPRVGVDAHFAGQE